MVEGFTWVKIQIDDQVVEQVGVIVIHSLVNLAVRIVLGMNILKDLDIPRLLAKTEQLCGCTQVCGL